VAKKDDKKLAKQEKKEARRAAKSERREQRRRAQAVLSRNQIAEQLRILATQFEAGTFVLGDLEMELPPYAEFELGYKVRRRGGHQIEVEVEWGDPKTAMLLPQE
jgi:amphi-Trp domain-containing protein